MEVSGQLHAPAAYFQVKTPRTHWLGGWVSPRVSLDAVVRRIIPSPYQNSSLHIIQPVTRPYTTELSRLLMLWICFEILKTLTTTLFLTNDSHVISFLYTRFYRFITSRNASVFSA